MQSMWEIHVERFRKVDGYTEVGQPQIEVWALWAYTVKQNGKEISQG